METRRNVCVCMLTALISACGQHITVHDESVFDEPPPPSRGSHKPYSEEEMDAYRQGIKDVTADLKGKLQGTQHYVFNKPIVNCGVRMPARVVNGVLIPAHEACVQIAPAQFTEQDAIQLPVLGKEDEQ